ncbi:hypothetical protein H6G54_05135 [Anabaena cylindrica FACHB-243]|uniref:Uncharacterized protein n=1 Tax=Anabaena cylindrica (strain ATCC 27899 / PCC 7122) TaxID=272123 RepID=K9ZPT5_ANACC|nr:MULTISPECIES: hypothetical protein [Anabaena]AFZ60804.1 hypothetical protein Anacy_5492 [Anabaena cylindrica PCC 7122]MBD2417104.1 hypothetical protein [Anabaena cylindrica FACHB-243]MBY5280800.1 hypothetical protein [Anabaena sp. CCAP 1446/1C]MBY5307076.1 hypothetical protein [Anabaena sp. CCAP 1446/1C]MCM2406805.1 hypothetical protein [Anabaena sp. CCAP 1446/1C]
MKGKSLTLIGTAITLAFSSNVAMAESSKSLFTESSNSSISSPTEIKMSPEGMKILCEYFPLNSRCPGGIPLNANVPSPVPAVETSPGENNVNPDTNIVPETPISPESNNSSQLTPAPESPSSLEFGNSGSTTRQNEGVSNQVPTTIVPQTPASDIRTP